jgi:hypothetical protein
MWLWVVPCLANPVVATGPTHVHHHGPVEIVTVLERVDGDLWLGLDVGEDTRWVVGGAIDAPVRFTTDWRAWDLIGPGDVDGDGNDEIVHVDGADLVVTDPLTGAELYRRAKPTRITASESVLADLDGDGIDELLAERRWWSNNRLRVERLDGTLIWERDLDHQPFAVGQADADADVEVIVGNDVVDALTGVVVAQLPMDLSSLYTYAVGDVDGDGGDDLLGYLAGGLWQAWDLRDGTQHWEFQAGIASPLAPGLLVDLDLDGRDEAVLWQPTTVLDGQTGAVRMRDPLDGCGLASAFVADTGAALLACEKDATLVGLGTPRRSVGVLRPNRLGLGDLDGDGRDEVVHLGEGTAVFDVGGALLIDDRDLDDEHVLFADVDDDGRPELATTWSGVQRLRFHARGGFHPGFVLLPSTRYFRRPRYLDATGDGVSDLVHDASGWVGVIDLASGAEVTLHTGDRADKHVADLDLHPGLDAVFDDGHGVTVQSSSGQSRTLPGRFVGFVESEHLLTLETGQVTLWDLRRPSPRVGSLVVHGDAVHYAAARVWYSAGGAVMARSPTGADDWRFPTDLELTAPPVVTPHAVWLPGRTRTERWARP